ncbi:MAG TPA: ABC transporter ATP-binding protein [Candidatus Avidehalobacter gallistercoris]|uniref:ABC transporter ATP-binding protein n=1 Tax=Candidatus Avidehalobacter gallistercoris TaxID=2840694 RepID=A0A9D1KZ23_9FIRM|nr:ABC transporter ATP-binding protein [Candidatus Avidehalobacter gallistercoris]
MNAQDSIIIDVKNLRKVYTIGTERVIALAGIDMQIRRGEICCLFGPSGSGKSTLLNMLAGLEKPTTGEISIGGARIDKMNETQLADFRRNHFGFVFQSYNLLPALTALENVEMPMIFRGVDKDIRKKQAVKMLQYVGLKNRIKHKPTQMSGGQQQRVGIARAFVAHPPVIFADEPTGNLDTHTTYEVMNMMSAMVKKRGSTMIIVTHDDEIAAYGDHIIKIRDGKILEESWPKQQVAAAE